MIIVLIGFRLFAIVSIVNNRKNIQLSGTGALYMLVCCSDELETVIHSDDAFAPVGYLNFKKMHLEDKKMVLFIMIKLFVSLLL